MHIPKILKPLLTTLYIRKFTENIIFKKVQENILNRNICSQFKMQLYENVITCIFIIIYI